MTGSLFNKVTDWSRDNVLKEKLRHRYFTVNFAKYLRQSFFRTPLGDWFPNFLNYQLYFIIKTERKALKRNVSERHLWLFKKLLSLKVWNENERIENNECLRECLRKYLKRLRVMPWRIPSGMLWVMLQGILREKFREILWGVLRAMPWKTNN